MKLIQIDRQRWKIGAVFAAASLLLMGYWGNWKEGAILAVPFLAAGCLKIQTQQPGAAFALHLLWAFGCMALSCFYPSWMMEYYLFFAGFERMLLNLVCAAAFYGVLLVLLGRIRPAVITASALLLILGIINTFVFQFRGLELQPLDVLSVGTALNVAAGYTFTVSMRMAQCLLLWLLSMFCVSALPKEPPLLSKTRLRSAAALVTAACVILFGWKAADVRPKAWRNDGTLFNGYLLNVWVSLRDSFVEKPEDYAGTLARLEAEYPPQEITLPESLPDIVVIMDESLADFRIFGGALETSQPVTPFLDSLTENTVRGLALTSVFGGSTASAEFELLTGCSMAFLPEGSIAYQQYLRRETFSLPRVLESYGYDTVATHPYLANGWNRPKAYPLLGFQEAAFLEDYPQQDLIREYVSDREMFDYILRRLDRQGSAPLFLFGITMQNHGGYTDDTYENTVSLSGGEYPQAEQYLSLIHETDKAVQYLFSQLEKSSRDTVVLLFGDHFPNVESEFFRELHGGEFETLSQQMLKYQVPYYIWANFDIPAQTTALTSLNYLPVRLLETAGLPLPSYYRFLSDMEQTIPAINAYSFVTADGQTLSIGQAQDAQADWLHRYRTAQYNCLFDSDACSPVLFP